jgi:hypothetical protein
MAAMVASDFAEGLELRPDGAAQEGKKPQEGCDGRYEGESPE